MTDQITTFVSYAREEDLYEGSKDWEQLTTEQQDKLIVFAMTHEANSFDYLKQTQIKSEQEGGLRYLLICISSKLQEVGKIKDSRSWDEKHRQEVLKYLKGTLLGVRLAEALKGDGNTRTAIEGSELAQFELAKNGDCLLEEASDLSPMGFRQVVMEHLKKLPLGLSSDDLNKIPMNMVKQYYEERKIIFYVDRGLAASVASAGLPVGALPLISNMLFTLSMLAILPLLIFAPWWSGFLAISLSVFFFKFSKNVLVKAIRERAWDREDLFNFMRERKVIWFEWLDK